MKITIRLKGDRELKIKLAKAEAALSGAPLSRALLRAGLTVAAQAQRNVTLGGTGLRVRTGRLRSSISAVLTVGSKVSIGTNVVYAPIHEFGGIINHPGGTAYFIGDDGEAVFISNARVAALKAGRILPRTRPHQISMPERAYLRPALSAKRAEVLNILRQVYSGPLTLGGP